MAKKLYVGNLSYDVTSSTLEELFATYGTVRSALRRMGYANEDMTAHGFRAMARTMIAERLNIEPQIIEAQLAHAEASRESALAALAGANAR